MELTFAAVDESNWIDLERLFEDRGGPHNCWCMVWRRAAGKSSLTKSGKKKALKNFVENQLPIGLLAYEENLPVAWCSIAPRETFRALGGDASISNVWALVCFYIRRDYRGKRMTDALISQAVAYARSNGARYVEAYPVDADSPSYRFMGFRSTFEKHGFECRGRAGTRRYVIIKKIAP
jgi:GNAT superfamily N-acetyltransferase